MFATTNKQPLPLVVIDQQGKRKRAKCVKLVVSQTETQDAIITQAVIQLKKH